MNRAGMKTVSAARLADVSPNARGAIYMVIGSLGYVTNDALIRVATDEGLGVYQALCLRGIAMTAVFAVLLALQREPVRRRGFSRPLMGRVAAEVAATALFFAAIVRLEFATAQTILLIVPFVVTLAAALVLGESVSARQYATVLVGFFGVLLVVQPGTDAFTPWSLAVIGAAGFLTLREFATRRVVDAIPASFVGFVTAVAITLMTGVLAALTEWNGVSATAAGVLLVACCCLIVGYVFTIQTVRVGDLSVSAPFRYTTLLGAVVLGLTVFDEVPNALTWAGCAVILVSGVYAVFLERRATTARRNSMTPLA